MNCHHCLQPANVGCSLRTIQGKVLKFCKINPCYAFYSQDSTDAPVIIIPLPFPSSNSELLLQVTKVISTDWSENTVVTIQLCIAHSVQNAHGFNPGQLYVLTQFRTLNFHAFFDFSISKEYIPLTALQYMQHKTSIIMNHSALLMLMLKIILEDALHQTSYKTLEGLVNSQIRYQLQHEPEDLSKETPELTLTEGMCWATMVLVRTSGHRELKKPETEM